jgi:hypothetical protein
MAWSSLKMKKMTDDGSKLKIRIRKHVVARFFRSLGLSDIANN